MALPPSNAYRPNWANQTIWTGDNLDIMRGMNSATVDLIYLDPPYNSKHDYAAPIGSKAAGAAFKDTWGLDDVNLAWHGEIKHEQPGLYSLLKATREVHGDSMMSYLIYMAIRIMEMRRLLRDTGSIYLHCDPTAGHYLKLLMDAVFGKNALRNEVVWCYSRPSAPKQRQLSRVHDTLFWYAKGAKWTFNANAIRQPYAPSSRAREGYDSTASKVAEGKVRLDQRGKFPESWIYIPPIKGNSREAVGYPTQKPLALLRRIVRGTSNEGDTVLDPFCGCATACIAAEIEGRRWAGIDISEKAADLVALRLHEEVGMFHTGAHRKDVPKRTDLGKLIPYNDIRNKKHLYGEQGGYCNGCETHFEMRHFHVDHIIPQTKGGTDHVSNLQLLCGNCNSIKGNRPHEYLLVCLTDKGWIKRKKAA